MTHFFEWLRMGGYSLYIWSAYGLACLVLIVNGLAIRVQTRRTRQWLAQWYKRRSP